MWVQDEALDVPLPPLPSSPWRGDPTNSEGGAVNDGSGKDGSGSHGLIRALLNNPTNETTAGLFSIRHRNSCIHKTFHTGQLRE
jgi:hypothetical protein